MGLIYRTQSDMESWCTGMLVAHDSPKQKSFHLNHFFCLFYTFYFYLASMFLSSTGNLPSQTLNILYCDQQWKFSWYRMGDLYVKVKEIEQNFNFFIFSSPHDYVLFAGQRENCYCGDHNVFTKALKEYGVQRWLEAHWTPFNLWCV